MLLFNEIIIMLRTEITLNTDTQTVFIYKHYFDVKTLGYVARSERCFGSDPSKNVYS